MHRNRGFTPLPSKFSELIVLCVSIFSLYELTLTKIVQAGQSSVQVEKIYSSTDKLTRTIADKSRHDRVKERLPLQLRWSLERALFDANFDEIEGENTRLRDGSLSFSGRVEVLGSDRTWGTICGDEWTIEDATVVCRQLGFLPSTVIHKKNAEFGYGVGTVVMTKVKCQGDEKSLDDCHALKPHKGESLPCSKFMTGASVTCGCRIDESPNIKSKCFMYSRFRVSSLTCHHHCPENMILVGDRIRTCDDDQTWTGVKPYCVDGTKRKETCSIESHNRIPCSRSLSSPVLSRLITTEASKELEKKICILQECCYDASKVPRCYLPTDSPCMLNKCQNGAECRDRPRSTEYECICGDKYGGRHCEYKKNWSCGKHQVKPNLLPIRRYRRMIGGRKAKRGSWPWIVRIKLDGNHHCFGTLVHPRWVLTAAHCTSMSEEFLHSLTVEVGSGSSTRNMRAMGITQADYNNVTIPMQDIALVKLDQSAEIHRYTNILCLPRSSSENPSPEAKCWIAGRDKNDDGEFGSSLHVADVPILSTRDCQKKKKYNNVYDLINNDMICAGYQEGGVDTCNGDSGGPLMCGRTDGTWYIAGVVSWGYKCGDPDSPGVYTRVSGYLNWIDSIIYRTDQDLFR